ncbi:hypothetical protein [Streptomyces mirabilis]|uniref:hypothetical protein n=1 Tax=Streptomyces mirabilis TaxID=68239 RepID=UPI00225BE464|nr:hypothetical protein [Streptomyces mirabilis]MCX4617876.1 hypothetical protein [Streptomyces mirabilis]
MSLVLDALPEFLGSLAAAAAIGAAWGVRQRRRRRMIPSPYSMLRHKSHYMKEANAQSGPDPAPSTETPAVRCYTALGSTIADGSTARITSTRLAGSTVLCVIVGPVEWFELTSARLGDGTYAAEPVDGSL